MSVESRGSVLLVAPKFFGYEAAIARAFEDNGFRVTIIDERPSNSSVVKVIVRLWPVLLGWLIERYYRKVWSSVRGQSFDLILVVKGEVVPLSFLRDLRRTNPAAVLAFYAYDAFSNSPRGRDLLELMDLAYSFDRRDVENVEKLRYKPLFYTTEFGPLQAPEMKDLDLAFIGTVHSGRYAIAKRVFEAGGDNYGFFFSPARWHHLLQSLMSTDVRAIPGRDVSFTRMTRDEVAQVFRRARAVIDVQREGQSGLTMRTFEVLASGTRLITTNTEIEREPFFDTRWVFVLKGSPEAWDIGRIAAFVNDSSAVPADVVSDYSVSRWVEDFVSVIDKVRGA